MQQKQKDPDNVDDNIIPFHNAKLLTGGKDGGNEDWLKKIEPGTTIVVSKRPFGGQPQEAICMEYTIVKHREDKKSKNTITLLYSDLNPPPAFLWVYSSVFSKITECVYVSEVKKNVLD